MVAKISDFRGGIFSASYKSSDIAANNELLQADNVQWRGGLKKRKSIETEGISAANIRGAIRASVSGAFAHIQARDSGTAVNLYYGNTLIASSTLTTGYDVEMAEYMGYLVVVNGKDVDPKVVKLSDASVTTLDELDSRTIGTYDWWAGQYNPDGTTTLYIDDSVDARDTGTDDVQFIATNTNSGFFVASNKPFNKIVLAGAQACSATVVAVYEYWSATGWSAATLSSTPTWTAAEADRTIEWGIPTDVSQASASLGLLLSGKYVFRVRFSTPDASAKSCDSIQTYNTQEFSRVMGGDIPEHVCVHNNRLYISSGYIVNYTNPRTIGDWDASRKVEYFTSGDSDGIKRMISYKDRLVLFKNESTYEMYGNTYEDIEKRKISDKGIYASRSAAVVKDHLFRVCSDGIWSWDGNADRRISTFLTRTGAANCAGIEYDGEYWVSYPSATASAGYAYTVDPDTIRQDDNGEWTGSFYKFTGYPVYQFYKAGRTGDSAYGQLFAIASMRGASTKCIARCDKDYGNDVIGTSSTVVMAVMTKFLGSETDYKWIRGKFDLFETTSTLNNAYVMSFYKDYNSVTASVSFSFSVSWGASPGNYTKEVTFPYKFDSHTLAVKIQHNTTGQAGIRMMRLGVQERRF